MNEFLKFKVVGVIDHGDDERLWSSASSDEDDEDTLTPVDPQDNASIAELLEKNSTTFDG